MGKAGYTMRVSRKFWTNSCLPQVRAFSVVYQIATNPGSKDLSQILDLNGTNPIGIQPKMTEQYSKNICVGVLRINIDLLLFIA